MESELIAWLRDRLPAGGRLRLGPGDDAAILRLGDRPECVVTVDFIGDGVDFHLGKDSPRRIGRKALAVNLSDLAAMAARPLGAVVALSLPRGEGALELAKELFEGMLPLADAFDLVIAGGDTNTWDGPLALCITALGEVTSFGPLTRSGGIPGDVIVTTGSFGGSILGRHFDFTPRVREAMRLNETYELHAGMDVSDGLSLDLSRLATASGCGAIIDAARVPIAEDAYRLTEREAACDPAQGALDHALGDGEDFELLLAVPPSAATKMLRDQPLDVPLTQIGELVAQPGLWLRQADGQTEPLVPRGYVH